VNGQYVGNGIVEINPGITNPDQLDVLLLHEMGHDKGGSEAAATFAESNRPMASHGMPRPYVPAGMPPGMNSITMELLKRALPGLPKR
jgi:hypothetical protein